MAESEGNKIPSGAPASAPATPPARTPSSRRRRRLIILIGILVLLVAIGIGIYYYWESRFYVSTDDAYIDGHPVSVSARVSGNIVGVYGVDNQYVRQNTLLVQVDPCDYDIALGRAQAGLTAAQANEQKAAADVESSRAMWTQQEQDLRRDEALYKQGAVTLQTLQHIQAAELTARANLNAAEKNLVAVRAQTGVAQVAVEAARLQLSYTDIRAPEAGYVTQKAVEVGSYVAVGQPVLTLVTQRMFVTANFKETQLTHMRPGQPATITVDAYPGLVLHGQVQSIQAGTGAVFSLFPPENATGNFVKVVQRVPVKIVFNEPPDPNHRLVLGLSVQPKVKIAD